MTSLAIIYVCIIIIIAGFRCWCVVFPEALKNAQNFQADNQQQGFSKNVGKYFLSVFLD